MGLLLLQGLEIVLGFVGVTGVGWLLVRLTQFISAKVSNAYLQGVLVRSSEVIFAVVKELCQTEADAIKLARADGKLTDDEKSNLKAVAVDTVKSYLGAKGLGELAKVLGFDPAQIDAFLGTKIEATVRDVKLSPLTVATGVGLPPR